MITTRQAEALWVAKHYGDAKLLKSTAPHSGSFKRMFTVLKGRSFIEPTGGITIKGEAALEEWAAAHPRTNLRPSISLHTYASKRPQA